MADQKQTLSAGMGIDAYARAVAQLQHRAIESQRGLLIQIAQKMADTIIAGKRIFVFGTGHSHMLAEEGYARAGGLMSVVPIFYTALMLHESIPLEAELERIPGLAPDLLDRSGIQPGEMLFVYSNSGVNHLPVEMALEAKKRGIITVTVGSIAFAKVAPLSGIGRRLAEVCDFAIDNQGVPGDGVIDIPGLDWKVGPTSTVIGATIWNALVVEATARIQQAKGDAPIAVSFNMPGYEVGGHVEEKGLQPRARSPLMPKAEQDHPLAMGVDLGATKIATTLIDRAGKVLASRHTETPVTDGANRIFDRIAVEIGALWTWLGRLARAPAGSRLAAASRSARTLGQDAQAT